MNRPALFSSALAVVALGFAVSEFVALRRAESVIEEGERERETLRADRDNVKQRLDAANQRLVQAEMQAASLKDDFGQIFSKKDTVPAVASGTSRPQGSFAAGGGFIVGGTRRGGMSFFRSVPPLKALETTYHVLYRQLKFTPGQIEQFKAAMTEAATRFEDLEREAKQKRVSVMDKSMQPLFSRADAELREKLTSHFGADALPVMERFNETLFLRDAVSQVAGELFYTEAPLSEPQANQLVDILAKNMRDPAGRLNSSFADAGAMKADAGTVLAPSQLAVWRELIDFLAKTSFASLNPQRR